MKKAYGLGALIIFLVFLLLRCSTNKDSIDKEIQQLLMLPDEFTSEWAIENDYVMNELENYSNINVLDEFIKNVNDGLESHVRIINFTDEGDIVINLLIYNGEQIESYLDTRRDEFGSQTIIKTQGHKIEVSEDDIIEHFIGPHVRKEYYLVGDNQRRLLIRVRITNKTGVSMENQLSGNKKDEGPNFQNDLPEYRIWKYSEMSGIRKYIGEAPLRIYPSHDAPALSPFNSEKIVNCIYTVTLNISSPEPEVWGMVLENNHDTTKVGFAPIEDLVVPDESEHKIIPAESLGGFKRGDRIEKLIGTLDRDYSVIHEMVCIYSFPDDNHEPVDPREDIFSENRSIDAFVNDYYQVTLIRTDSPQFQLACGFKVGDKASDVFRYFEEHYTASDDNYYANYNYSLSQDEVVSFRINTPELVDESLIESIWIH